MEDIQKLPLELLERIILFTEDVLVYFDLGLCNPTHIRRLIWLNRGPGIVLSKAILYQNVRCIRYVYHNYNIPPRVALLKGLEGSQEIFKTIVELWNDCDEIVQAVALDQTKYDYYDQIKKKRKGINFSKFAHYELFSGLKNGVRKSLPMCHWAESQTRCVDRELIETYLRHGELERAIELLKNGVKPPETISQPSENNHWRLIEFFCKTVFCYNYDIVFDRIAMDCAEKGYVTVLEHLIDGIEPDMALIRVACNSKVMTLIQGKRVGEPRLLSNDELMSHPCTVSDMKHLFPAPIMSNEVVKFIYDHTEREDFLLELIKRNVPVSFDGNYITDCNQLFRFAASSDSVENMDKWFKINRCMPYRCETGYNRSLPKSLSMFQHMVEHNMLVMDDNMYHSTIRPGYESILKWLIDEGKYSIDSNVINDVRLAKIGCADDIDFGRLLANEARQHEKFNIDNMFWIYDRVPYTWFRDRMTNAKYRVPSLKIVVLPDMSQAYPAFCNLDWWVSKNDLALFVEMDPFGVLE